MKPPEDKPGLADRLRQLLIGPPRDLHDRSLFHRLSLIPILAWVGLGADGLSSSSYGPDEAFRTIFGPDIHGLHHTYLAVGLAMLTAFTVCIIAAAYAYIIEHFPHGGGGYIVATHLLGPRWGVVSGCALLVDYVLTITVSVAAAGAALFSFVGPDWQVYKVPLDFAAIVVLIILNIRGVRESVLALAPIFAVFALTHLIVILGGIFGQLPQVAETARQVSHDFRNGVTTIGGGAMLLLFLHAYSLGSGTYTGLEAVSNGLTILREPRVHSGKRTMLYMAISLAFTAGGLLLLYLLWQVTPEIDKTMNALLVQKMTQGWKGGALFAFVTILSEGALLIVGAQAGFVDGPRVLANMAIDSWFPRRFASLSERLTNQNGIILMGLASLGLLLYTRGDVRALVVLYSINVFVTFSLSMFGMLRRAIRAGRAEPKRLRQIGLFTIGFILCVTILLITVIEKFREGAWLTLVITGGLVFLCFVIKRHYRTVVEKLQTLYAQLENLSKHAKSTAGAIRQNEPTAAILVGSFGGLGIHTLMNIFRVFPGYYKNVVFLAVGVLDSGEFKGERSVESLRGRTEATLQQYVKLAHGLGIPGTYRYAIGTEVVEEAEQLCLALAKEFPRVTFFAGKVIFEHESWYQPLLHNETALTLQKRLHWNGYTTVIMPARVQ